MPKKHTVRQGECIASIASKEGFFPDTLWNHGGNSELKSLRGSGYVLMPGDVIEVPELRQKEESKANDQRHRFKRKGVPEMLRLRLLRDGEPRKNLPYRLIIDNRTIIEGSTDGDGKLEHEIPPGARHGELKLQLDNGTEEIKYLRLGGMDPVDKIEGVQKRLENLGYYKGSIDGKVSEDLETAIRRFQMDQDLNPKDGKISDTLRNRLKSVHGC